ncbi:hypothetical protein N7539_000428 [Penicillium diatomitis]|uniref:Uncharacterized protein n=1 Tax=Penicillium diatomitis TaxID=2819901 RepID=A0A9W9XLS3_9EURO|nr:uncharacterized protein N7539_000428 [Penicillium diatomitis]KAJ5495312.1 hypothetical protein N7539_000428 [Penicillium diatomitis]
MLAVLPKKVSLSSFNAGLQGWRPTYLRRRVLLLFLLTFISTITALEALFHASETHNGIAASSEGRHYLWTYGPTAILTVITTFWARVEFQSKQNAPWRSMLEGPQPAEKSVLLDYISDMQPVAMWKAFCNQHEIVFAGLLCSLLLQLVIVFSTGLLTLRETYVPRSDIPVQLHNEFRANRARLETVGSQPWDIINGVLFDNLTYPSGTNENVTFQEFSAPSLSSDAEITAHIKGLGADLDCSPANVKKKSLYYLTTEFHKDGTFEKNAVIQDWQLTTPSCSIRNQALVSGLAIQSGNFQDGQCENINGTDGARIIVSMLEISGPSGHKFRTSPPARFPPSNTTYWGVDIAVNQSLVYICKPTLSLINLQAKANSTTLLSNKVQLKVLSAESLTLPGITPGDISSLISKNASLTTGFRSVELYRPFPLDAYVLDSFKIGLVLIGADVTIDNLWRDGVLRDSASAYYRAMTAQLLHSGLSAGTHRNTTGSAIVKENRVVVLQFPLRGIEACLVLITLLVVLMILRTAHRTTATWNPAHIASIAAITAESGEFRDLLRGLGGTSEKALHSSLAGKQFFSETTLDNSPIKVLRNEMEQDTPSKSVKLEYSKWNPFPGRWSRVVIFVLVASMIAALEVLLHLSRINEGLGDASSANESKHYLWTILPALVMSGTRMFFAGMNFNIKCLAPYARLKKKDGSSFRHAMSISFVDALGLNNTFRSMQSRHFAVQITTLAAGAAFLLTIVVSGLYSTVEVPTHISVNFTQVGGFPDPRTIPGAQLLTDEVGEVAGILTSEYVLQYNFSFPPWTYEELAFAKLSMNTSMSKSEVNGSFVDVRVPALRAAPVCHIQTEKDLLPVLTSTGKSSNATYGLIVQSPDLACPGNNTDTYGNFTLFNGQQQRTQPFGYSSQGNCHSVAGGVAGQTHYTVTYVWGYIENLAVKHIAGMVCMQFAETVDVSTRFKLPGMEIDLDHPPVPDESSVKPAPDLYTPIPEWWVLNKNGIYAALDGFFQILVSGKNAIPVENLQHAQDDAVVIEAIKRQHKIINALQFSNYTRGSANDTIRHDPLPGNMTSSNRLRVVQDATSTRILDGLLAAMLVLGIIGSWLLDTDTVLPKSPCSIAAVASLVADSRLLDQYLEGAWTPDHSTLDQIFSDRRFYLGWWQDYDHTGAAATKTFTIDHVPTEGSA